MMGVFRRIAAHESGGALVELAVALPLLVLVLAATIDFGRVFQLSISLQNAARAGALYGAQGVPQSFPVAAMENAAVNSTTVPDVTAAGSRLCQCADDVTGEMFDTSPANACTYVCPAGRHLVMSVTVETRKRFTTLMNVIPGMPAFFDLSRSATLRVAN